MMMHIEENDKPLTKEQVEKLKKIKMPKCRMSKGCRYILKPNRSIWKKENKDE